MDEMKRIDMHLVTYFNPISLITEEYRDLCVNILSMSNSSLLKVFAVTAPSEKEENSFVASNLAICMSRELKRKILLVDAYFSRPIVHDLFGIDISKGLYDFIKKWAEFDDIIKETPVNDLNIVTAGGSPSDPIGVLSSERMKDFFVKVKERFDFTIVCAAPILSYADVAVISSLIDGILLVAKSEVTQREELERAEDIVKNAQGKILGCVLTSIKDHVPDFVSSFFRNKLL